MRGCAVILNLLIANVFWLICKDEGKRRNDRLGEGGSIFPYIKTSPSFLKSPVCFYVREDGTTLTKSVIPSFPFILTFYPKHADNQSVKNDRTSPHPPFSRAFQVPSQAAFSNSLVYFLHLFLDYRK